jgi:CRP/FNR family transcriptional regulator, cyclic AMP receptor protein
MVQALDELISQSPVFAGLSAAHLQLIAGCGINERFDQGSYLFREGAAADRFYLIRSGSIALEVAVPGRGAHLLETLGEGEVVGWSWLFEPYRWQFDGRAVSACRVVTFDGACLRGKCESDHELGYGLMRRFAASMVDRLQATRLQLLDVYGNGRAT